ncbi:MAG: PilZ domain-containing protein [Pyrinomonadaceae bacterium]|nr:PilZ domain-containing protein [Pyrinomonadaceae bacterium]
MTTNADEKNANLPRDERRASDRSRLIVDVFFNGQDATGVASTKDIGAGGLYMNTQAALPEGALLTLRIPLGENEKEQIVVNAEVIYINPGLGVGVSFHGLPENARAVIERALAKE